MGTGLAMLASCPAGGQQSDTPDLADLSLEELMDLEVFSVARRETPLIESAAAIFAITGEEISRCGATTLAEALRLVPGMEVARIDASKWAISSRGFNDLFANKLLVLVDGRTVYTPLFSGVFWDTQDLPLEDVERIEVIRGPGAALWGANAVNGVINVITRSARETRGGLVSLAAGTEERGLATVRYGGARGDDLFYRVYLRTVARDDLLTAAGNRAQDAWDLHHAGFRLDWEPSTRQAATVQGALYTGTTGQAYRIVESAIAAPVALTNQDNEVSGGHLMGRWSRAYTDRAELILQTFFDRTTRDETEVSGHLDTYDVDLQHRFGAGSSHELLWGLGYRIIRDQITGTSLVTFRPAARTYDQMSAFVQDEVRLIDDRVHLTGGVKLERGDLDGWSIQPSVRARWTPQRPHTVWAAVSRALRAPSRAEHDMGSVSVVALANATDQLVVLDSLEANRAFRAEHLLAFEMGYRGRVAQRIRLDVATYLHRYDGLRALATWLPHPDPTAATPTLVAPVQIVNGMHGHTWGLEVAAEQRPRLHWRLRASYTFQVVSVAVDHGRTYLSLRDWERSSPRHQLSLRSSSDLSDRLQLDLWGRYVDRLPGIGVDRYMDLDARLSWRMSPVLEASLVAQNLLTSRRGEFRTPRSPTLDGDEQRAAYASLRWHF